MFGPYVQAVEAATKVSIVLPTGEELICDPILPKHGATDTISKSLNSTQFGPNNHCTGLD